MKKEYLETSFYSDFEKVNEEFLKCTISVLSPEQIANRTKFIEESIVKAMPSLNYAPVIGYVTDKHGDKDFGDHGQEIVINDDGDYEVRVKTIPYGVVIKDSQRFIEMVKDNGEVEKYLLVDCYLWKRYEEATNIVKENRCNQSMEVLINEYDYMENYIEVKDFTFSALCILGENVTPAFNLAKIRTSSQFSQDKFKEQYESMIFSLNKYLDTFEKEEGIVEENKEKDFEATEVTEVEPVVTDEVVEEQTEEAVVVEETPIEEEIKEIETPEVETVVENNEDDEEFAKKKKKKKCSLEEIQETEEYQALVTENEGLKTKYATLEVELGKANVEIARVNSEFTKAEEELTTLREFKTNVETAERKEKVDTHIADKFSFVPEIEMAEAREKAYKGEISMDEFDNAVYIVMGRKGLFSANETKEEKKTESMRLFSAIKEENTKETECEYESIAHLFTKRD